MSLCFLQSGLISMESLPKMDADLLNLWLPWTSYFFWGPITLSHILIHRNHKTLKFIPTWIVDVDGINGKATIPTRFYGSVMGYEKTKLTKTNQQIFGHSGAPSLLMTIGKEFPFICGWGASRWSRCSPFILLAVTIKSCMAYEMHIYLNFAHFHDEFPCRIYPTWLIWVNHKSLGMVMWQLLDA